MFRNKSILITGATGSFGKAYVEYLVEKHKDIKKLIIFSRDELKQFEMINSLRKKKFLRFFLGDVRDRKRLKVALSEIDIVIHAAALKQVPAAEYNPTEFIKTNIYGAQNIIEASLETGVQKVIALSTDKSTAPLNLYGATKLCSDKLFIAANNYAGGKTTFCVVKYGNVMGSRGSVIPHFISEAKTKKTITVTDKRMTRFNITLNESIELVNFAVKHSLGGETFVPKLPAYKIMDLVKAVAPNKKILISGIRPGEKIHEEMITKAENSLVYDIGKYYLILSSNQNIRKMQKKYTLKKVSQNFELNSNNCKFLNVEEIRRLIKKNLIKNFKPL